LYEHNACYGVEFGGKVKNKKEEVTEGCKYDVKRSFIICIVYSIALVGEIKTINM
jgi:hypothetical protein